MRKKKIRFIYMIIVGVAISFLLDFVVKIKAHDHNRLIDFLASIIITILVWEGNLMIDDWMNSKFPWVTKPGKRLMVHLPVSVFFSTVLIYLAMLSFSHFVCNVPEAVKGAFMSTSITIGVLVSLILISVEIGTQFFGNWKKSLIEIEKYQSESLQAQLQNLKNQINPHFLFNNMSVLSSLVYKDQDKAVDFINQLSKVYRYLLENQDSELVTLESELNFIQSYTYLLQIRFDTNIKFEINISEKQLNTHIPPMALQLLIENAIKHNEVSSEQPLTVSIRTINDILEVTNNIQLRTNYEVSSKTGLRNIKDRYVYFTDRAVEVIQENNSFTVRIPLLNSK
jgi:two-component system LytT family sensor kinase